MDGAQRFGGGSSHSPCPPLSAPRSCLPLRKRAALAPKVTNLAPKHADLAPSDPLHKMGHHYGANFLTMLTESPTFDQLLIVSTICRPECGNDYVWTMGSKRAIVIPINGSGLLKQNARNIDPPSPSFQAKSNANPSLVRVLARQRT